MMNTNERISWIDILKGIAIVGVFVGHTTGAQFGNVSGFLNVWVYSFHMPLFFFLSGYVFSLRKYENYKYFFMRKVKSLIVPMVFLALLLLYLILDGTIYYWVILIFL